MYQCILEINIIVLLHNLLVNLIYLLTLNFTWEVNFEIYENRVYFNELDYMIVS